MSMVELRERDLPFAPTKGSCHFRQDIHNGQGSLCSLIAASFVCGRYRFPLCLV